MSAQTHKRSSLVDLEEAPAAKAHGKSGGGSMTQQDKVKMIVAVVVIVAAMTGLAAYYGVFSGSDRGKPTIMTTTGEPMTQQQQAELKKEMEEQQAETEEMIQSGEIEKPSAG